MLIHYQVSQAAKDETSRNAWRPTRPWSISHKRTSMPLFATLLAATLASSTGNSTMVLFCFSPCISYIPHGIELLPSFSPPCTQLIITKVDKGKVGAIKTFEFLERQTARFPKWCSRGSSCQTAPTLVVPRARSMSEEERSSRLQQWRTTKSSYRRSRMAATHAWGQVELAVRWAETNDCHRMYFFFPLFSFVILEFWFLVFGFWFLIFYYYLLIYYIQARALIRKPKL